MKQDLRGLYCTPDIIRIIKSERRKAQTKHVASMKEMTYTHTILVRKLERKGDLGDLGDLGARVG